MKKILIPTDFSMCAQSAAEVAMEIAKKFGAHLYFLHLCDDPMITSHVPSRKPKDDHDPEIGHCRGKLNDLVAVAERFGVAATPVLVLNKGNDHIENYIEPYGIDWIVMGSHGATGIREMVIGSNTERLVKHSSVPVLVIKKRPKIIDFKNIVLASTFESLNLPKGLGYCIDFARAYGGKIHLLYLNFTNRLVEKSAAQAIMNQLVNQFPPFDSTNNIIETNDAEWGIDEFVREVGCDVIAIMPDDTESIVHLMAKRIAVSLVNHEAIPVLVLITK
jgi:nucleotide-binding universal stress UspA family protein